MILRRETDAATWNQNIIANYGIGCDLHRGIGAVPNDIPFYDIAAAAIRTVRNNARIASVMDYVVANDIRVRSALDLDAIPLVGVSRVVNRVGDRAIAFVAADVNTLAGIIGVEDVVASRNDVVHRAAKIDADGDIMNAEMFERHVGGGAAQVDAVGTGDAIGRNRKTANCQVR